MTVDAAVELDVGMDFRRPELRREVFQRFYSFHLRHRSHPGGVYYLMPYLRERLGWDEEEALWFAFLNGNTQHPPTSLLLHRRFPRPEMAEAMLEWAYRGDVYNRLAYDTDRRYHRKHLATSVRGYVDLVDGDQAAFWKAAAADGWWGVWSAANAIPTFGRLSAFSYCEYLRIMGAGADCTTLFLDDLDGSKSHRNGLAIVAGRDDLDWHISNPTGFDGRYPPGVISELEVVGSSLLAEARRRNAGEPWEGDVGYFTFESALCTYKSWHRPNRRYPNVYNDMLRVRLDDVAVAWPDEEWTIFWDARRDCLPRHLRVEDSPADPGLCPEKQNHYRETGCPVMMSREYPEFANEFDDRLWAALGEDPR